MAVSLPYLVAVRFDGYLLPHTVQTAHRRDNVQHLQYTREQVCYLIHFINLQSRCDERNCLELVLILHRSICMRCEVTRAAQLLNDYIGITDYP